MSEQMLYIATWIVGVIAALSLVARGVTKTSRKVKGTFRKADAISETLLGAPAILHPETGAVIVPARPGLGVRLGHMEDAIVSIADTQKDVRDLAVRVDGIAVKLDRHIDQHDNATHSVTVVQNPVAPTSTD